MAIDQRQSESSLEKERKEADCTEQTEIVPNEYLHLYPLLVDKTPEELKKIEKKLLNKLDYVFLPVVTLMLLMGYERLLV
jgi:hypothetical protein